MLVVFAPLLVSASLLLAPPGEVLDPFDESLASPQLAASRRAREERLAVGRRIEQRALELAERDGWGAREDWDEEGRAGLFYDYAVAESRHKVTSGRTMLVFGGIFSAIGVGLISGGAATGDLEGVPLLILGTISLAPGVALLVPGAIRLGIHRRRLTVLDRIAKEEKGTLSARLQFRGLAPLYIPTTATGGLTLRFAF